MALTTSIPAGFSQLRSLALLLLLAITIYSAYIFINAFYIAFLGPLRKYPGPKFRAFSIIPKFRTIWTGTEAVEIPKLHERYGPVVRIAPNELSYLATSSQTWRDIYGFGRDGKPYLPKEAEWTGKVNATLFSADNPTHTRLRKVLAHSFADRSIKELEPMLKEWVVRIVEKLNGFSREGEEVDMLKLFNCGTFDIMADMCFNESLHMLENYSYTTWTEMVFAGTKQACLVRALRSLGWPFREAIRRFAQTEFVRNKVKALWRDASERVDKRLANPPQARSDLWTKICQKGSGPDGLTLPEHYGTAVVFMSAGTETVAAVLSGTLYHLLRNPSAMHRLTTELRAAFPTAAAITMDKLATLPYLTAAIQESLRLYPPGPISLPRTLPAEGHTIAGAHVPGSTIVGIHHLSTYTSAQNFTRPREFHPERWLKESGSETENEEYKDDNLNVVEAFSVGPRSCLGKNLAWHEVRLILAGVLVEFDVRICEESEGWEDQRVFQIWERAPLMCRLEPVGGSGGD